MTRPVYIYTLCERGNDEVRYVGQTVNPEQRLKAHVSNSWLESSRPKERWIAEVILMGGDIEMRIIEECAVESAGSREKHWIAYYLESGSVLTNISMGAGSPLTVNNGLLNQRTQITTYLSPDDLEKWKIVRAYYGEDLGDAVILRKIISDRSSLIRRGDTSSQTPDEQARLLDEEMRSVRDQHLRQLELLRMIGEKVGVVVV